VKSNLLNCINRSHVERARTPTAIVTGTSRNVWSDLRLVQNAEPGADVIAVGISGVHNPHIKHWVSLHPEFFKHSEPMRNWRNRNMTLVPPIKHTWKKNHEFVDYVWFGDYPPDFSGCFAVMIALMLGYENVIICGIPHDNTGRFCDPFGMGKRGYPISTDTWHLLKREYGSRIRAMSGLTKDLFGEYPI
jgi:hypothetical protein